MRLATSTTDMAIAQTFINDSLGVEYPNAINIGSNNIEIMHLFLRSNIFILFTPL